MTPTFKVKTRHSFSKKSVPLTSYSLSLFIVIGRGKTTCCHSKQVYDDNHSKLDYTRMIEQFCHTDRFMELECLLKFKNRFRSASLHIPSKLVAVELRFARTRWYIFPDRLIICNMGKVIFPERFEWIRFLNFSPISTSI